jgi:hypothetical protein
MGGNLVNYPGDCGTPTVDLLTIKLLLNSVISTPNAKFMTLDLKDFYLMTPMKRHKYFRMKIELFPQDIINQYDLSASHRPTRHGTIGEKSDQYLSYYYPIVTPPHNPVCM